ncbi:2TM domain-containing protein [Flavobacterium adhaerens]|uniref:2TM domain-containing protein n=1 Tax=Flavobacterium adhaerens TaxID=3149043 RepID=UPI0032B3E2F1
MERLQQTFDHTSNHEIPFAERYEMAFKRVKRVSAFYNHLIIYIFISIVTIIANANIDLFKQGIIGDPWYNWRTYSTALFWGIIVLVHGIFIFGQNLLFGLDWEERKIKEILEKDKNKQVWK